MDRTRVIDRVADYGINFLMVILCICMVYPFLYVLAYSFSDGNRAMVEAVTIFPKGFTLENYATVLQNDTIYNAAFVSVARTVVGIFFHLAVTGLASYAISKRGLPGNKWLSLLLITPMFISGGLLPTYVLIYHLGLFNNFMVFILPLGFSAFHMLIMRTFFMNVPDELEESAKMDGAGHFTIFSRIYLPLSTPVLATVSLFIGVQQWNSWFDALLYVTRQNLMPLQLILQKLLNESLATQIMAQQGQFNTLIEMQVSPETIKMSTLIIATVPIVLVYPFLQRFFIKGVMIGAVKG